MFPITSKETFCASEYMHLDSSKYLEAWIHVICFLPPEFLRQVSAPIHIFSRPTNSNLSLNGYAGFGTFLYISTVSSDAVEAPVEFTDQPFGDDAENISQNHDAIYHHNGDDDTPGSAPTLHRITRFISDEGLSRFSSVDVFSRRQRRC